MSESKLSLASLLQTTFSSVSQSTRLSAESQLKSLSSDLPVYAGHLLEIINSGASLDLRNSACLQLRSAIKQAVDSGRITASERISILESVIAGMRQGDSLLKKSLGMCLSGVLISSSGDLHNETCKHLLETLKLALCGQPSDVAAALRALSVIFASGSHNSVAALCSFYTNSSPQLASLGHIFAQRLQSALSTPTPPSPELISILDEWTTAISTIFEYFELSLPKSFKEVTEDFQIAEAVEGVLMVRIAGEGGQGGVLIGADSQTAAILNGIKRKLLQTLALIFQYLTSRRLGAADPEANSGLVTVPGVPLPPSPFITSLSTVLEPYISACCSLCSSNLSRVLKYSHISSTVLESLQLALQCAMELPFSGVFSRVYKQLIVLVALPLLHCSPMERGMMESHPDEFVNLALDTCEKQKSHTLKTVSAQLLHRLCDQTDGALTFTVVFLMQLLEWSLIEGRNLREFAVLMACSDGAAILGMQQEERVEVALMGLCVLSDVVRRRSDLMVGMTITISSSLPTLMTTTSPLLKSRLCLFLSFFFTDIFPTDGGKSAYLHYLTRCLDPDSVSKVVYMQACAALERLVKEETILHEMDGVAEALVRDMVAVLPLQREKSFFEAFQEILSAYPRAVPGSACELLERLVDILREELNRRWKRGRDGTVIAKSWAVIRTVVEDNGVMPGMAGEVERVLEPLIAYLNSPEEIDCEDNIVLVWTAILKQTQNVSPIAWSLYSFLPSIQLKYSGDFGHLFPLLNSYLSYGSQVIFSNPSYLSQLISMSTISLFAQEVTQVRESSQSEGLVLIQEVMLLSPAGVLDSYLPDIYASVLQRYSQGSKHPFFPVRLLETFLAGLRYDPGLTLSYLSSAGQASLFFTELSQHYRDFSHSYDKKIATFALLHLVCSGDTQLPLGELFSFLVGVLALRSSSACPRTYSEDCVAEDRGAAGLYVTSEEAEVDQLLNTMLCPLKDFDEIAHFRSALMETAAKKPDLCALFLTALDCERRQELKDVLNSQRIPTNNGAEPTTVRLIQKAKRKLRK